mgnify:CR=1 FL=1|jgi:hypothetical protein
MEVLLKCAACGTEVPFDSDSPNAEATCPECEVHLRRRPGDERMAIPVGMVLPEKFSQVDLKSLSKQSEVLIERYRKVPLPSASAPTGSAVDATLAKALESLAHTISHLDERLARQEKKSGGESGEGTTPLEEVNGDALGGLVAPPLQEEVVHLGTEEHSAKALPLKTQVLVRREAAQEARKFQRKKQRLVDHRGREQMEEGFFQSLMEKAPKTTVGMTLAMVVGLTWGMIYWMDPSYRGSGTKVTVLEPTQTSSLGQLWADDPEAGQAETVAKAYLNATTAKAARSFVFESDVLGERFDRLYRPIDTPGEYDIVLKSRVLAPNGEGSVFAYRVTTGDAQSRMMVMLPEGKMPKVYWQFFGEIGDMSWEEFMEERPSAPTAMRVWVESSDAYFSPYNPDRWTSYTVHDYEDGYTLQAFAERASGQDWKLKNALKTEPRKFGRRTAIMAQVKLSFMSEMPGPDEQRIYVAEIREVEATDWLPPRFRPKTGPTMEASEVEAGEAEAEAEAK